jgi:predicted DNA-binding transcriptional regulator AlpA
MNLLKPEQVSVKLGISKSALPALRQRDKTFPAPIRVSARVIRWDEADIDKWLESRKET